MKVLKFLPGIFNQVLDHGNSNLTDEVCGAGIGRKLNDLWLVEKFIPITNVVKQKQYQHIKNYYGVSDITDYIPDPNELYQVLSSTRHMHSDAKFDLIMIFHTHPHCRPRPSYTDRIGASFEAIYLIYSPLYKNLGAYYTVGDTNFELSEIDE